MKRIRTIKVRRFRARIDKGDIFDVVREVPEKGVEVLVGGLIVLAHDEYEVIDAPEGQRMKNR